MWRISLGVSYRTFTFVFEDLEEAVKFIETALAQYKEEDEGREMVATISKVVEGE